MSVALESPESLHIDKLHVSPLPSLHFREALPLGRALRLPFPFDSTSLRYYYMGRNGIFELAQLWKLRGEEILMPAYFHGVEADTLKAAGVKMRYYPVDGNMRCRVEDIEARLSPQTKAVYLIHYLGFPGPVEEVREICARRGLPVIEDCALALLSRIGSTPLGSLGDAAVFSLHKTLPLPHGGALVVRGWRPDSKFKMVRPPIAATLAYTATALWRDMEFEDGAFHNLLRMTKKSVKRVSGQIGVVPVGGERFDPATARLSMSRLSHWVLGHQDCSAIVERRRENYIQLLERLRGISPPIFGELPRGVCPLFYPMKVRNKPSMLARLLTRGVDAINFWSTHPSFIPPGQFPEVETLRQTVLELPCHQDLGPREIDGIADVVWELRREL